MGVQDNIGGTDVSTTAFQEAGEERTAGQPRRRINTVEELVIFTRTNETNYTIYINGLREFSYKRRLPDAVAAFSVDVAEVELLEDMKPQHELLQQAIDAINSVVKREPDVKLYELNYDIYLGEMDEFLGSAKAWLITASAEVPFSGDKWAGKKAWAVGFENMRRIKAKYPPLSKYVFIEGSEAAKGRAYVSVVVKLPKPSEELSILFDRALQPGVASTTETYARIRELESLIRQKEEELNSLRKELAQLRTRI